MGSSFDSWNDVTGAIYVGHGTAWEVIWLLVAVGICVAACVAGSRHELDAYRRLAKKNGKK